MADNDPSPAEIADLERQQKEAEMKAEFAEADRKMRAQQVQQEEYDRQRAKKERELEARMKTTMEESERRRKESDRIKKEKNDAQKESRRAQFNINRDAVVTERAEAEERRVEFETTTRKQKAAASQYAAQNPKAYTGFGVIDRFLDKADAASEQSASKNRISRTIKIERDVKSGAITPEYGDFLKQDAAKRYEKEKKPVVRMALEFGEGLAKGADEYIPQRSTGVGIPRLNRAPAFNEGMGSRGAAAPRKSKGKGSRSKGTSSPSIMGKGFSTGINSGVVAGGTGMGFAPQVPKFQGPALQTPAFTFSAPKFATQNKKVAGPGITFPRMDIQKPSFGNSAFGKANPVVKRHGKSQGPNVSLDLNLSQNPFGRKKTNPLKDKRKFDLW